MGSTQISCSVTDTLFGKTRQAILTLLYTRPSESFYLREIARRCGTGLGATQRDLGQLSGSGLLVRERRGNQVFYRVNVESVVYDELRSIIVKTTGAAESIRLSLAALRPNISIAIIFGSVARGQQHAKSDVDLLIVAEEISFERLVGALKPAEAQIGREINPILYTCEDFSKRVRDRTPFLHRILNGPVLFVIGTPAELGRLGEKRLASPTSGSRSTRTGRASGRRGSRSS